MSQDECGSPNYELWDKILESVANREKAMPTEQDALIAMFDAYQRLKEFGWRESCYCPKDGTLFDAIEAGSTGIHTCHYDGEWPKGTYWIHEDRDLSPSRPILFRLKNDAATGGGK